VNHISSDGWLNPAMERELLEEIMRGVPPSEILRARGVFEALRVYFAGEVLEEAEDSIQWGEVCAVPETIFGVRAGVFEGGGESVIVGEALQWRRGEWTQLEGRTVMGPFESVESARAGMVEWLRSEGEL